MPRAQTDARVDFEVADLDEYARLVLTDAARFPSERLLLHARWLLGRLAG